MNPHQPNTIAYRFSLLKGRLAALVTAGLVALILLVIVGRERAAPSVRHGWQADGLHGVLIHSIAVSGTNHAAVVVGTVQGAYRQTGHVWLPLGPREPIWSITISASGQEIVTASEDGMVVTYRGGMQQSAGRILPEGAYAVAIDPRSQRTLLAGGVGGIERTSDGGTHWHRVADLGSNACDDLVWTASGDVFAALVPSPKGRRAGPVLESRDGGRSWRSVGKHLPTSGVMSVLVVDKGALAGTMGFAVWRHEKGSKTWVRSSAGMPATQDHGAAMLTVMHGSTMVEYVGTIGHGIYRSTDGGRTWTSSSSGLTSQDNSDIVLALAYENTNQSILAGTADGLYRWSSRDK